jgi:zinc transport system ATP-binding protein
MAEQPVIELSDLAFAYDGVLVLDRVNLTVCAHESVCVVGPNGGGKTTLLKLILGLLRPTAGTVRVFGQPPERVRLRVGYMPQRVEHDPLFPATVMDIVLMGRLGRGGLRGLLGWYSRTDRRAALQALAQVGMEPLARRPLAALSGGQRQRVLIARALCCQPDLLLLDEPTANVDTLNEDRLFEILRQLSREMTVLVVSHDLGFVSNLVETVVCVNRQVVVHPTSQMTGELVQEMYGGGVRMVRHSDVICRREHVEEGPEARGQGTGGRGQGSGFRVQGSGSEDSGSTVAREAREESP